MRPIVHGTAEPRIELIQVAGVLVQEVLLETDAEGQFDGVHLLGRNPSGQPADEALHWISRHQAGKQEVHGYGHPGRE